MSANPFGAKRYWSFDDDMKRRFGGKIARVSLDGGFTCPNRDGSRGTGGCTFCSGRGSGEFAGERGQTLAQQVEDGKRLVAGKWSPVGYLAYFQAFSNTYASLETLRSLYEQALAQPGICGLIVATRPDCLNQEIAAYLQELARRCYVQVELGLQTASDRTAARVHRCYSWREFLRGVELLHRYSIRTGVHLINGLPGEDAERMRQNARSVAQLPVHSIKIHMLHVLRNTAMAVEYAAGRVPLLTQEEYVGIVCDQLELLPGHMVIDRLTGDGKREELLAPLWTRNKRQVLNDIAGLLRRRDSWQGKYAKIHCNHGGSLL